MVRVTGTKKTVTIERAAMKKNTAAALVEFMPLNRKRGIVYVCLRPFETADGVLLTPENFDELTK